VCNLTGIRRVRTAVAATVAFQLLAMGTGFTKEPGKTAYGLALDEAKKAPNRADFRQLRILYTEDPSYEPYVHLRQVYREHHPALFAALEANDFKGAIKHAQAILEIDYLDTESHFFSARAYEALGKMKQAEFHRQFFQGVMDSILATGDGLNPQSAIVVITLTEEWAVLSRLGYPPGGTHSTAIHDGVTYDVLTGTHVQTGEEKSFYFRPVDAFWKKVEGGITSP